jgi:hypothetical protein
MFGERLLRPALVAVSKEITNKTPKNQDKNKKNQ